MNTADVAALPFVSLVIPTYNREEPLKNTLVDAIAQDYPTFETIVVDQTKQHTPEIAEYLDKLTQDGNIILFKPDFASLPGARNYAIRRAKGEIIIFIDDDIRMDPNFIRNHVNVFLEKPEVGAVAGRVLPPTVDEIKLKTFAVQQLPPEALDPGIAWTLLTWKIPKRYYRHEAVICHSAGKYLKNTIWDLMSGCRAVLSGKSQTYVCRLGRQAMTFGMNLRQL